MGGAVSLFAFMLNCHNPSWPRSVFSAVGPEPQLVLTTCQACLHTSPGLTHLSPVGQTATIIPILQIENLGPGEVRWLVSSPARKREG